jgi:hypothetical protein
MSNIILTPDQLQSGLKPSFYEYHIDTRTGRAIVLLPDNKNQERPSVDVPIGCTVTINDLYGCFESTVEIRAPKNGSIDGKLSITISENNANVKFTLVGDLTWVSNTSFNRNCETIQVTANIPVTKLVCNFNFITLYNFDLSFDTKYMIDVTNLRVTKDADTEISHVGDELFEYASYYEDGKFFITVTSKYDGVLSVSPISLLRK